MESKLTFLTSVPAAPSKNAFNFRKTSLREAAGYHLMVSFHGTAKPTGQY